MSAHPQGNNKSIDAELSGTKIPDDDNNGSSCPVKHQPGDGTSCPVEDAANAGLLSFWGRSSFSWWSQPASVSSAKNNAKDKDEYNTSCPAAAGGSDSSRGGGLWAAAASVEEAARHAQTPQPDQTVPLDRERQVSSIPRRAASVMEQQNGGLPHHQYNYTATNEKSTAGTTESSSSNDNDNNWVYPSEQQLYNAMRRKGWSNVPEESIPTVLQIHNHINEHTWRQIRAWEGLTDADAEDALVLTRFQGRPRDLTPKAFFLSQICGRSPPFDRHDWYVQRRPPPASAAAAVAAAEQRYVIDYYYLPPPQPHLPPIPYVDARPALDRPRALLLHGRWFCQTAFPGITAYLRQQRQQQPPHPQLSLHSSNNNNNNSKNSTEPANGSNM